MFRRLQFNLWYFSRPPWDSGISPPELFEFMANHPAGSAIDLGCGTGTNVVTLAQHGWQVTGIDFAPRAIHRAKQKVRAAGLSAQLQVGDVTHLNGITGPFELALDLGCFHGLQNKAAYLDEMNRVLSKGGFWLMYGFFKSAADQPGPGLVEADLDLIRARGFRLQSRTDGWDKRQRPSAWFLHIKE